MKKILLLFLLSLAASVSSFGQINPFSSDPEDSLDRDEMGDFPTEEYAPLTDIKPLTALLGAGLPVAAFDLLHLKQDAALRGMRNYYAPRHRLIYDDLLAFTPLAAAWGMRLGGVKGRSDTALEALTAQGITLAAAMAVTYGGKYGVGRMRPDGSSATSFPSGHSAFAFASAAILDAEYGERYPWLSLLGYSAAAVTAAGRILNNRHWASDVVTGAGIGLGSAYLGYYLSDLIFKKGSERRDCLSPQSESLWMLGVEKGFQTYLSGVGDYAADRIGNSAGLTLRIPLYKRWGARLQGTLLESRNAASGEALQGYAVMLKADYMHPLWDGRIWLDANAGLGYGSEMRIQAGEEPYETSAPFVTENIPLSLGAGATLSLLPRFGVRLAADYLYAFNARPYSRDTKKGMKGFVCSLSLNYLLPR